MQKKDLPLLLGIDLGTSCSSVAAYRNGRAEIVPNNQGKNSTYSYVSFQDDGIVVGDEAKESAVFYPTTTIFDSKRMIGRRFNDKIIQKYKELWPFKVINEAGLLKIEIKINDEIKYYTPTNVSSHILKDMGAIAIDYFGQEIDGVVITVPADFNHNQREETRLAAKEAGLNVLRIVDEPTAAAIAYSAQNLLGTKCKIIVFDFGGGTLDVSLVEINDKDLRVVATCGDQHLGGHDIDNNLFNYFADIFKDKTGYDIRTDNRAFHVLLQKCENVKITLTNTNSAKISCPCLYKGHDFVENISIATFNKLNENLFQRILNPVINILQTKKLSKSDVDYLLVGGSSRIPRVREILEKFFGKKPKGGIDCETAVVQGASIIAANSIYNIFNFNTIISHNIGVGLYDNTMDVLIKKNTDLPYEAKAIYTTTSKKQTEVRISIYSGDDKNNIDNDTLLGEFVLEGIIPEETSGVSPQIHVYFNVDRDGILNVTARDMSTCVLNYLEITVERK
ncbi:cytoplasmic heat shock protein 70 [Histomonas meleagridis]|uniref:cytoplasmic heat shock protein 70 n=1 Tax=Histomonas meleagridis TaxID=135588 RepID=UPI00355A3BE3|nr:cytoplasmic heat shock protein 70 [Histomonas meleagridis]KAH0799504.1 cytoplasmic heat shock protein 70 [Histomonas meleagridis]